MKTPSMKAISAAMLCCYFMSVLGCGRSGRASPPGGVDAVAPPPSLPERFADLRSTALAECGAAEVTRVDLLPALEQLPDMPPELFAEQLRDFVVLALAGDQDARISPRDAAHALANRPLIREEWPAATTFQEHGPTRHLAHEPTPGQEELILLAPLGDRQRARLIQEGYQNYVVASGHAPASGRLVGYLVDLERAEAHYCTLAQGSPKETFHPRQGWARAQIRGVDDLRGFLAKNPNLLEASCKDGALELAGLPGAHPGDAPVTLEHVASIYQPPPADRLRSDPEVLKLAQQIPGVDNPALQAELARRARLYPNTDAAQWIAADVMHRARTAQAATLDRSMLEPKDLRLMRGFRATLELLRGETFEMDYGFSLDPQYPPDFIDKFAAAATPEGMQELLAPLDPNSIEAQIGPLTAQRFAELGDAMRKDGLQALEAVLYGPAGDSDFLEAAFLHLAHQNAEHNQRQCARYDGPSMGTEVGMVMFYTDLGMKLYGLNTGQVAERAPLAGTISGADFQFTDAECRENVTGGQATSAALWLELRPDRVKRERRGLAFAPTATGVFGKTDASSGHVEAVDPTWLRPGTRRATSWWTERYPEVAAIDHEFARLDQFLKWQAVAAWLADEPQCHAQLAFLNDVPVRRDWSYPDWVQAGKDRLWRVEGPAVSAQVGEECLPVLTTRWFERCDGTARLSGGVGGATSKKLAELPKPAKGLPPAWRTQPTFRTHNTTGTGPTKIVGKVDGPRLQFHDTPSSAVVEKSKGARRIEALGVLDAGAGVRLLGTQSFASPSTITARVSGANLHKTLSLTREPPEVARALAQMHTDLGAGRSLTSALRRTGSSVEADEGGVLTAVLPGSKHRLRIDPAAGVDKFDGASPRLLSAARKGDADAVHVTYVVDVDGAVGGAGAAKGATGAAKSGSATATDGVTAAPRGPPPMDITGARERLAGGDWAALRDVKVEAATPDAKSSMEAFKALGEIGTGAISAGVSRLRRVKHVDLAPEVAREVDAALTRQHILAVRAGRPGASELRVVSLELKASSAAPRAEGFEQLTPSVAQVRPDGSIAGVQPKSPFMSVATGADGSLQFEAVAFSSLRDFAPPRQGGFPAVAVKTAEPVTRIADAGEIGVHHGVLGQPLVRSRPAESRARARPWTDYTVGKYRGSTRRVLLAPCDRDGGGVDESEWSRCVCDEDLDRELGSSSEKRCAERERAVRLRDGSPALSGAEWAALHCDQDGDGALTQAAEQACERSVLP